jgi:hypothetical protein
MESKTYDDKHIDSSEHIDRSHGSGVSDAKKLINPLHGIPKEQLLSDVDRFCAETGMTEHNDVFRRGALVAQRPEEYEEIPELTEDDLFWLRKSTASKWSHPKMLYFAGKHSSRLFAKFCADCQSLLALLVPLPKDGIRPDPTVLVGLSFALL